MIRLRICAIFIAAFLPAASGCVLITRIPADPKPPKTSLSALESGTLTRENALADLEAFMRTLENVHPGPYFLRSREAVDADRRRLTAELPASMTRAEWWTRLAPLVASLGDGHTLVSFPLEEATRELPSTPVFPAEVAIIETNLVITAIHEETRGIARGDRILSINGHDTETLLKTWTREGSGDSQAGRMADVASRFSTLLAIHSIRAPYAVRVSGADRIEREVALQGVIIPSLEEPIFKPKPAEETTFDYRAMDAGVGYMNFHSMAGDSKRFEKDIAAMFRDILSGGVRALVIDLRQNGGGDDALGEELLRYVTEKPHRNWATGVVKRSNELRSYMKSYYRIPFRWLPLYYFFPEERMLHRGRVGSVATWREQPVVTTSRAEPFFSGPVCILTGSYTFSAAVVLADAVKAYHLATLVGEETGGHPNFFSEAYEFVLPGSGLLAKISTARWVRANGDATDQHGVIPDILVKTTARDIREGRDPVLERARNCPAAH